MNIMTKIMLILAFAFLTACGGGKKLANDNSVDYKTAKQFPEIKMPEIKAPAKESDSEQKK